MHTPRLGPLQAHPPGQCCSSWWAPWLWWQWWPMRPTACGYAPPCTRRSGTSWRSTCLWSQMRVLRIIGRGRRRKSPDRTAMGPRPAGPTPHSTRGTWPGFSASCGCCARSHHVQVQCVSVHLQGALARGVAQMLSLSNCGISPFSVRTSYSWLTSWRGIGCAWPADGSARTCCPLLGPSSILLHCLQALAACQAGVSLFYVWL